MTFDEAIEALFRAPHGEFVNERKRLAVELRTSGDKPGAAKLNKLTRPPASAWAVNQLWWRSRAEFQALLDLAKRIREGEMDAVPQHKAALAALGQIAAGYLKEMGNAAVENTVRRVETSLAAIAAGGGFDPDPPGALTDDRDPSGFLSLGIATGGHIEPPPPRPPPPAPAPPKLTIVAKPEPAATEDSDEGEGESGTTEETRTEEASAEALEAERAAQEAAEAAARRAVEIEAARTELVNSIAEVSRLETALNEARKKHDAAKAKLDALQANA